MSLRSGESRELRSREVRAGGEADTGGGENGRVGDGGGEEGVEFAATALMPEN